MNMNLKVVSDSMAPLIKINESLSLTDHQQLLNTFDIIVFRRSGNYVVHYVWRNQISFNHTVITRSLKNIFTDEEPVRQTEILGRVTNFKISTFLKIKILVLCLLTGKF